ncbi:MAG TPA: alpha/beta hydrolase [Solirubrobacteraceae bacterium]|nr:alpha/beta hydrolase [Solirubrobacteraceae bacterium]
MSVYDRDRQGLQADTGDGTDMTSPKPRDTIRIGFRTVEGTRIRYADSSGPAEQSILLTNPWPESVYAFAPSWSVLAQRSRLFAVDPPGFGGSERRDDLMSPQAMGEFLVRLIDECDLGNPHIVGPDIGTSAALFAAASCPGLLSSVVVGSGGTAVPIQLRGPLEEWALAPDLDAFRAMDPRAVVGAALDTIEGHALPGEIREDYLASYEGDRFVESMRYVRSYPDQLPILADRLPEIETPVQIIAGRRDRVVPLANAEFLDERLPNSKLTILDAGHFLWEEAAAEYASIIADWVAGGCRATAEEADR